MNRAAVSINQSLEILCHLEQSGSVRVTSKQFLASTTVIQPSEIGRWKKESEKLQNTVQRNPRAPTCRIYSTKYRSWNKSLQLNFLATGSKNCSFHAKNSLKKLVISIQHQGKGPKKLLRWVHSFHSQNFFSVHMRRNTGRKLSGYLLEFKQNFCRRFVTGSKQSRKYEFMMRDLFVSMDENAIYFDSKPKRTETRTGSNSVAIHGSGSTNQRFTVHIFLASIGTNIPPLVIFKE